MRLLKRAIVGLGVLSLAALSYALVSSARSGRYRINSPTIALILTDGRYVAHTIPVDAVITVQSEDEFRTFNVTWDGKAALIFALDLESHAAKV
jgi:hypothetical protein